MGTRADFYIKKADEKELVWISSIAWDGYPDGIDKLVLEAKTQTEFIAELQKFLQPRTDVTLPDHGWPWPWNDSGTTDYAYCFHNGKVYANCFGNGWFDPFEKTEEDKDPSIIWEHDYPDMSNIKNVRYDRGSGLIVISMPK